ncbi:GDP-mannose 4,6-dehydratase [Nitrospinae bacterium AH_259_B05_G02_I21]|nr:GDP-mannose 4,6-dehydratase [Nitrospinae bacterium AH_259_B05_G02_I21]
MKILVTGGAGFIGVNTAKGLLEAKHDVVVLDNCSRLGAEENLAWLQDLGAVAIHRVDLRHWEALQAVFAEHDDLAGVIHLAGQVAVTSSVADPREDFESNALGTFNVLEALRLLDGGQGRRFCLYSSTNKVYGTLDSMAVKKGKHRYAYRDHPLGVDESAPLDFHSPYGCSKGAADQYVRDYARVFGVPTVVLRQSCIYGPRQFGVEDQGWVAWFTIAAVLGKPITIFGDGKQVRDVLHVDDLVKLFLRCIEAIPACAGRIFNVGGGPDHTLSLLELISLLEKRLGTSMPLTFVDWRPGDQRIYVSDIRRAQKELDWKPTIGVSEGIEHLCCWVVENQRLLEQLLS